MTATEKAITRHAKKDLREARFVLRMARKELALIERALRQYNLREAAEKARVENQTFYVRSYTLPELQDNAMNEQDKREWANKFFSIDQNDNNNNKKEGFLMAKKLTVSEWVRRYEMTSAAEKIALVYVLEKRVYMALLDSLQGLPVRVCDRIDDNGAPYQTLRLDLKQSDCLRLRDKGSALIGWSKDIFNTSDNKGVTVEKLVIERYHGTPAKVGAAYYESGDATIAGQEIQIKFQNATLARIDTIRKVWRNKKRRKA